MRRLLLATTAALLMAAPAMADTITVNAFVDGVLVGSQSSADGNLDIAAQAFGTVFNLNSLSINSEAFLAAGDLLSTNTLNVNQTVGGTHQLVIDIVASGLLGPGAVVPVLSSFSVSGLTAGWSAEEQTFIDGSLLSDTGTFTATSDSAFEVKLANLLNPFSAEAKYTINSVGVGRFNGGIDLSAAQTPIPASLPLFLTGLAGLYGVARRRKRKQTPAC
jgi:hypothetical protein